MFVPSRQRSDDLASSPSTGGPSNAASSAVGRSLCLQESYASTHMRTRLTARVCSTRRHAGPAVTACRRHDWWPWGLESSVVHGVARASCTPPARATIILLLKAFRSRSGTPPGEHKAAARAGIPYHAMAYREGEARRLDTGRQAPLIAKESLGSTRKPERALESRDGVRRRDLMSACARLEAAPCRAGRAG